MPETRSISVPNGIVFPSRHLDLGGGVGLGVQEVAPVGPLYNLDWYLLLKTDY